MPSKVTSLPPENDAHMHTRPELVLHGVYEISKLLCGPGSLEEILGTTLNVMKSFLDMSHRLIALIDSAGKPEMVVSGSLATAAAQHKGRFELADKGTLFMDEIGEISAAFQAKLLRVLQEGEFERVGGSRTIKVDVLLFPRQRAGAGELRPPHRDARPGRHDPGLRLRL